MTRVLQQDVEYVDVRSGADRQEPSSFYEKWLDRASARHATPELIAADTLRRLHPGHSLVVSDDFRFSNSLLEFPDATIHPSDSYEAGPERVTNVVFRSIPSHIGGKIAGTLVDNTIVGSSRLTWNNNDLIVYTTQFQNQNFIKTIHFILHDGPERIARDFLLAVCLYAEQANDEIWVFNRGNWSKSKAIWNDIKDASWDNVVMKEDSKMALQKDVYGFFKSEATYKKLSIPWKRGVIMCGPPGNGKTISIKVIMKTCNERGFTPLYVKSFHAPMGEEVAMQNVFSKTRQLAPCVLILEDLDSLINDRNRSFFLNELDGLEGNDGLLVIASTNHFDRLDAGLSNRPSRFDRKYLFNDPDYQERMLYAKFWQAKLKDNVEISFPDSLIEEVAQLTQGFSFAYLKEAFVSTLVRVTNVDDNERVEFSAMLKSQIMALRKELGDKSENVPVHEPIIIQNPLPAHPIEPDERSSRVYVKPQPNPSQDETSSQRYRGPVLDAVPSVEIQMSPPFLTALAVHKSPIGRLKPLNTGNASGTTSTVQSSTQCPQGHATVLPAPASAYPQVMPDSLSFMQGDRVQHSRSAVQFGPGANASGTDA